MGVDWFKMRPNISDLGHLKVLVEAQSLALRQWDRSTDEQDDSIDSDRLFNSERLPTASERKEAKRKYIEISNTLESLLAIEPYHEDSRNLWRVYPITRNCLFPSEWRIADERTILPTELPTYYSRWSHHIQAVGAGKYRGYLFEWYLYIESLDTKKDWEIFQHIVSTLDQRENAWAKRIRATDIPQQIMALQAPPYYPPPCWLDWAHDPTLDDFEADSRYTALQKANYTIKLLKKAWNSHVGQSAKFVQYSSNNTFDQFLAQNLISWTDEFLLWVADCINGGFGLYLDG